MMFPETAHFSGRVVHRDGISRVKCKRLHKYLFDVRFISVTFLSNYDNVIRTRLRVPNACCRRQHTRHSDFSKNETMGSRASVSETARKNNLLGIRLAGYLVFSCVIFSCIITSIASSGRTLPSWS